MAERKLPLTSAPRLPMGPVGEAVDTTDDPEPIGEPVVDEPPAE